MTCPAGSVGYCFGKQPEVSKSSGSDGKLSTETHHTIWKKRQGLLLEMAGWNRTPPWERSLKHPGTWEEADQTARLDLGPRCWWSYGRICESPQYRGNCMLDWEPGRLDEGKCTTISMFIIPKEKNESVTNEMNHKLWKTYMEKENN